MKMLDKCPFCGSTGPMCWSNVILRATGKPFGEIPPHLERRCPKWVDGVSIGKDHFSPDGNCLICW